jgi:hypothetical protein
VECGGCEHRFRINDEVIVRGRKFLPGERSHPALNRFHGFPCPAGRVADRRAADPLQQHAGPGGFGTGVTAANHRGGGRRGGMIVMALLLMFVASRGGIHDGMMLPNRLLMAGFAG